MEEAFLGAIVGSGVTIIAQWFLGPQIERRVRAQERWEQFLVELASLMEGNIKQAQDSARAAWTSWHGLHQLTADQENVDVDRLEEVSEGLRKEFQDSLDRWRGPTVRADWLARRITGSYAIAETELRRFYTRWIVYRSSQLQWSPWDEKPTEDPSEWDRISTAYKDLSIEIESLSTRIGLPVGLAQRVRACRRRRRELRKAAASQSLHTLGQ